jgi:hypothetical protein
MRRHELDPVSLVFGFAFTAAGLLFLAGRVDQVVRLHWLWPLLLLALGLGILLDLGTRRPQAPAEAAEVGEVEPPVATEPPAEAEPVAAERVEAARPAPAEPPDGEPLAPEEATRTAELDREDAPPERDR